MRKIIAILLVAATLAVPSYCEVSPTAQVVSPEVVAELNKPVEKPAQITTGGWVWIGVFTVVSIVFGSWAYSTKQPI